MESSSFIPPNPPGVGSEKEIHLSLYVTGSETCKAQAVSCGYFPPLKTKTRGSLLLGKKTKNRRLEAKGEERWEEHTWAHDSFSSGSTRTDASLLLVLCNTELC